MDYALPVATIDDVLEVSERYRPGRLSVIDAATVIEFLFTQVPAIHPDKIAFVKNALSEAEHQVMHEPWFTSGHAADYQALHDALAVTF
jgi:hypothetical protein